MKKGKTIRCLPEEGNVAFRIHPKVRGIFSDLPTGNLLDIGTGKGHLGHELYQMGFDVYACDALYLNKFKELKWKKVDLNEENLPYDDNYFDYVLFIEVVEHLENPSKTIRELSRVLKTGGIAVMSTPFTGSLIQKIYYMFTGNFLHYYWPARQYGHITPLITPQLNDMLKRSNLEIEKTIYDRGWLPLLRLKLPAISIFGDHCIMKLKKN